MTASGVYKNLTFIPFYDINYYSKEKGLIKAESILKIDPKDLFAGPLKSNSINYVMYAARG